MYALGVDLGTTFTAAATWRNGHAEIASLGSRAASVPSVVLLREDETFLTGETANRRGLSEPHRVAREFKRRFGDTTPILLGGVPYSAEALMAQLLRAVIDEVARREGGPASSICISHPANWGPYKTDLLHQAVRLSGLEKAVTFTTEPEAAAVFYAQQQRIEPGAIVAVYDLGGGTFDAAVLRKTATGFAILGQPEGIERLGGIDFDAAVFNHVSQALGGKLAELDEDDSAAVAAVARLREECIEAKEALSADTDVTIPVLLPNISTEIRLTRAELESMVRPALYASIEALQRALRSAGVTADQLHSVLLVGGSSRMPIVAQLVSAELGRPVAVDAHPKHAVALGAAWLASGQASGAAEPAVPPGSAAAAAAPISTAPSAISPTSPPADPWATAARGVATVPIPAGPAGPAGPTGLVPAQAGSGPGRYGVAPAGPPEPPGPAAPASRRKLVLAIAGAAVAVLLVAGGVGYALNNTGGNSGSGQQPTPGPATGTPGTAATTAAAAVPPDEQCTDAIKANTRWVCLTRATFDGQKITIEYQAEFAGSTPDTSGGFHLHIYGGDGTDPPDSVMGAQAGGNAGNWYVEDQNPSVRQASSQDFKEAIGTDAEKVCARIADRNHRLVRDTDGNFKTGNCVKIEKI
jgi:actin-like ATPase involved in cell morphogenesis